MVIHFSGFELDLDLCELRREGRRIPVQRKALDLLIYLIRFRGRIVSREELLSNLWSDAVVTDQALNQALYVVRKALIAHADGQAIIQTVRGRGFRFVADVTESLDRPAIAEAPFVGRSAVLGELEGSLRAASNRRGGVVLLAGEPGIGKSRLAEKFADLARERAAIAHLGRCLEADGAPAFWPWMQLLRAHAAICQPAQWRELLAGFAADLGQIASEIDPDRSRAPASVPLEPGPARFRLFDSMVQFWRRAGEETPVVLILDDLHRADAPSWLLFEFLARNVETARILLIGTYREVELHRDEARSAALGDVTRLSSTRSLELQGFSREEVRRFVELTLADPLSAETVDLLHARSNGNPFFLSQLTPMFDPRREIMASERSNEPREFELPRSLREAITRQLVGLSQTCQELLTVAAVIGRDFTLSALDLATEHPRGVILDAISAASEARTIHQVPERVDCFRFAHILVRDALYESLTVAERAKLHKRVGESLERMYGPDVEEHLSELAHHFCAALPAGDVDKAIEYTSAAGRDADGRLAFEEAVRHYERALRILDLHAAAKEDQVFDLLLALGEAQIRAGQRTNARDSFRRAAKIAGRLGEPERLASVALGLAPGFFAIETGVYDPFIVSLLEDALEALPPDESALRARLLARLAMALYWSDSAQRRKQLIDEASRISDRLNDPSTDAYVMHARLAALWGPDNFGDRVVETPVLVERAERVDDRELSLIGRVFRIATLLEAANREEFDREIDTFCRLVENPRHLSTRWYALLFRSMRATINGRFDEAEWLAGEFLAAGQRFQDANSIHAFGTLIATVRWHQGRGGEMINTLYERSVKYPALLGWRCALAAFLADNGHRDRAMRELASVAGDGLASLPADMHWLLCTTLLAEACGILGDTGWSEALYGQLKPYENRMVVFGYGVGWWGSVSRLLGILATSMSKWSEAEEHFRAALDRETQSEAQPWVAWTLLAHARMLVLQGRILDRDRAVQLARAAKHIGAPLGMTKLINEAERLLLQA